MRKMSPCFVLSPFLAILLIVIALPYSLGAQGGRKEDPPLTRLEKGNQRFLDDPKLTAVRKVVYAKPKQEPYAIVLSCSDSRVPPEIVFGEWDSLGDLFVIRVAGNVVDPIALGSIEYAAKVLKTRLILVLGHERCGAVEAAINQAATPPEMLPPNMAWFTDPIKLAVERTKGKPAIETIRENVRVQIQNIRNQSSIIRELEQSEGLRISGGLCYLTGDTGGSVDFFEPARTIRRR